MARSWPVWITGTFKLLVWGLGLYGLLCLLVFLFQRRMMYLPDRETGPEAVQRAVGMRLVPWKDGVGNLLGWRRAARRNLPRILVLHGNAGDALGRVDYLPVLEAAGFEGVLLEYPGFGPREGQPTEAVLVGDARAALRRLKAESPAPVFLLGESLGSGVAARVAAEEPRAVAGLLLAVPFARMTEVAAWHYPYLPMKVLLRDRWDALEAIRHYPGPVAVVIAGKDEVVGAAQGRELAHGVPGPMRAWEVPGATHNELPLVPSRPPWSEVLAFLRGRAEMGQ